MVRLAHSCGDRAIAFTTPPSIVDVCYGVYSRECEATTKN